jgi:3-hydroxybutyryl-CoA dehydratase
MNEYRFSDLKVDHKEEFQIQVTEEALQSFAKLSGDDNPLHVDADYAKSCGFADRVVFGLLTASYYSQLVGVHLPGKYALLQGIDVTFHNPVFVGDELLVSGVVSYLNEAFQVLRQMGITWDGPHHNADDLDDEDRNIDGTFGALRELGIGGNPFALVRDKLKEEEPTEKKKVLAISPTQTQSNESEEQDDPDSDTKERKAA